MMKMSKECGVELVTCDQCMYGSSAADGSPVKKPTTFMTNAPELARQLGDRCSGKSGRCGRREGGVHTQCRGKTARMAAIYHFKLCRAILIGFRNQLRKDGTYVDGFVGLLESRAECERLPVYRPWGVSYRWLRPTSRADRCTCEMDVRGGERKSRQFIVIGRTLTPRPTSRNRHMSHCQQKIQTIKGSADC